MSAGRRPRGRRSLQPAPFDRVLERLVAGGGAEPLRRAAAEEAARHALGPHLASRLIAVELEATEGDAGAEPASPRWRLLVADETTARELRALRPELRAALVRAGGRVARLEVAVGAPRDQSDGEGTDAAAAPAADATGRSPRGGALGAPTPTPPWPRSEPLGPATEEVLRRLDDPDVAASFRRLARALGAGAADLPDNGR